MYTHAINGRIIQSSRDITDYELETIFIDKLTEKYRLVQREIKKAFNIIDVDNSGIFDLNAIRIFCKLHLYGFDDDQIDRLVRRFNIHGNGFINIMEFLELILKRIRNSFELNSREATSLEIGNGVSESSGKYISDVNLSDVYKKNHDRQYMSRTTRPKSAPLLKNCGEMQQYQDKNNSEEHSLASELRREIERNREIDEKEKLILTSMFAKNESVQVNINGTDNTTGQDKHIRTSPITTHEFSNEEEKFNLDNDNISHLSHASAQNNVPTGIRSHHSHEEINTYNNSDKKHISFLNKTPTLFLNNRPNTANSSKSIFSGISGTAASVEGATITSDMTSKFDPTNIKDLNARAKVFLQNLKIYYTCEAMQIRKEDRNRVCLRLNANTTEMINKISKELLTMKLSEGTHTTGYHPPKKVMSMDSFISMMSSYVFPGVKKTRSEVFQYIFKICNIETGTELANPDIFVDLVFGSDESPLIDTISKKLTMQDPDIVRGPVPDKAVGLHGPYHYPNPPGKDYVTRIKDKYTFPKSSNTMQRPANYTGDDLIRSSALPSARISLGYAFGMKTMKDLHSGPALHCIRDNHIVYCTAALGVVHNLQENSQVLFNGHDLEITCVTVDPSGRYAATGQIGVHPKVLIWETSTGNVVRSIGDGFFSRGVCAVCFSYDAKYICAVSCDEKHTFGIWDATNGNLITKATAGNDNPPQIRTVMWCPSPQYTGYISKEHDGHNDLFITGGVKVLKFWSFRRPPSDIPFEPEKTYLENKLAVFENRSSKKKTKHNPSNIYLCSSFVRGDGVHTDARNYNAVVGGDKGYVYLFGNGVCVKSDRASAGPIYSLKGARDFVFVGCAEGTVKKYDCNLKLVVEYVVVENPGNSAVLQRHGRPLAVSPLAQIRKRPDMMNSEDPLSAYPPVPLAKRHQPENNINDFNAVVALDVSAGLNTASLIAATADGQCFSLDLSVPMPQPGRMLFSFHTGHVFGVTGAGSISSLLASVGEDYWLCIWCLNRRGLLARKKLQHKGRCCAFEKESQFVAVGLTGGIVAVYHFDYQGCMPRHVPSTCSISNMLTSRHDSKTDITDLKFSPKSDYLAVGSHDGYVDIYRSEFVFPIDKFSSPPACTLTPYKRLDGHSSFISHVDWSYDGKLLQSQCGAHELLYWDVEAGRQFSYTQGWNPSDSRWKTYTCTLGFTVMGVYPEYKDATDVLGLHVSRDRSLVATGNKDNLVHVYNYPCTIKNAPRLSLRGHGSHVAAVKFMNEDTMLVSVGSRDQTLILWKCSKGLRDRDNKPVNIKQTWHGTSRRIKL